MIEIHLTEEQTISSFNYTDINSWLDEFIVDFVFFKGFADNDKNIQCQGPYP